MKTSRFRARAVPALAGLALLAGAAALLAQAQSGAAEWTDILPPVDLHGWTRIPIPPVDGLKPKLQWRVDAAQHVLICSGDGGHEWLRYDQELGDFIFQVDWRFTPRGPDEKRYNSGIGIRLSKYGEIWYQAQTGLSGGYLFGDNFADGAIVPFNLSKQMKENRVKAAGEWNHYEITARGDRLVLAVNGMVVNELSGVGLRRGYLGLEAEHYEVTFRDLKVKAER
jgi:hypothetical protein